MSTTKPISADFGSAGEPSGEFSSNLGRAIFQQKIESVLLSTKNVTGADGVAVSLREGAAYVCRASIGDAPEIGVRVEPGQGICGRCISEAKTVVEQEIDGAIKSVAAVPVMREGKAYGFVAGFALRPHAFSAEAIEDFQRMAELIHSQVEPIIPMTLNPEMKDAADDDLLAQLGIVPDTKSNGNHADEDDSFLTELVRDVLGDAPSNKAIVAPEASKHEETKSAEAEERKQPATAAFPARTTEEVLMQVVEHKPLKPLTSKSGAASAPAPAPMVPVAEAKPTVIESAEPNSEALAKSALIPASTESATTKAEPEVQKSLEGEAWTWRRIAPIAIILLVVAAASWYFVQRQRTQNPEPQKVVTASPGTAPAATNPAASLPPASAGAAATQQPNKPAEKPARSEAKPATRERQPILVATTGGPSRANSSIEETSPSLNGVPVKLSAPVLPASNTDVVFGGKRSTGATPAKLIQRVEPTYPLMARSMHVSGKVRMELTVATDGRVKTVRRLEGNQMLANAAEGAVRRWRYEPAKQNGTSVESVVEVIFDFK